MEQITSLGRLTTLILNVPTTDWPNLAEPMCTKMEHPHFHGTNHHDYSQELISGSPE